MLNRNRLPRSKRETENSSRLFAAKVKLRDGGLCRAERRPLGSNEAFKEHGASGPTEAAHIYDRDDCGEVKYHEDLGCLMCLICHDIYDNNYVGTPRYEVRVPPSREERAWNRLIENQRLTGKPRVLPVRRIPPE